MKKRLICIMLVLALLSFATFVHAGSYIGNAASAKFHYLSCEWSSKIKHSNRVYFNNRQVAINAGYTPCRVCNP